MTAARREISVRLVWPFQRVYGQLGMSEDEQLQFAERLGVPLERLVNPDTRVPLDVALENLERATARFGRTDLGLLAAGAAVPGDFGPVELAARACATVEEAIFVLASGTELWGDGVHLAAEPRAGRISLRMWTEADIALPSAAVEFALGSLWHVGATYLDSPPRPDAIRFMHSRVPHAKACVDFFGCKVEFDRTENALDLPRSSLEVPIKTASPLKAVWLTSHVGEQVAATVDGDLIAQVEKQIVRQIATGIPTLAAVAKSLGTSERTVHRKLKAAGKNYRGLCDEVRLRLAVHYLEQTNMPIKQIAAELGYGDVQIFHRAFKRLTQQTPQQRRQQHGRSGGD